MVLKKKQVAEKTKHSAISNKVQPQYKLFTVICKYSTFFAYQIVASTARILHQTESYQKTERARSQSKSSHSFSMAKDDDHLYRTRSFPSKVISSSHHALVG